MALGALKSDTSLIGLDIGTTGIRVVQVRGAGESRLVTYGAMPIDPKVAQSDAEIDKQAIIAAIKKLLEDSKVSTKNVVAGLPSAKVFTSIISVPKMSVPELAKSIKYQAEQHVPMSLDQTKLDWMLAGDSPDANQQEVLLAATPVTLSERYLSLLETVGLEVLALEPDAVALTRALASAQDGTVVLLDVGANATDLVIAANALPKLMRSVPVGGETFVKAAGQNLNLEPDQAFQFVYKFGLAEGKMEGQVKKAIKASVDSLVSEVDKSIKFYLTRYKDTKIAKVVLTGKAAMLPDLPMYLANSVGLPVEIGNAWAHLTTPVDLQSQLMELSNQFAVAAGLAERGSGR